MKRLVLALGVIGVLLGAVLRWWRRLVAADAAALRADPHARELTLAGTAHPVREQEVVSADGTRLHVEVHGPDGEAPNGVPTVVLAHGWTCGIEFWTPLLRTLPADLRVVAYDQRGHGRSATPGPEGFTPDALADDLHAVLEATVPGGEKAVLVGHSMGAMSVVAWAGRYPQQVRERAAAALLASTGISELATESLVVPLPAGWRRVRRLAGKAFLTSSAPMGHPSPVSRRALRYIALSPSASPAQVELCERVVLSCRTPGRVGWGKALYALDLRAEAAALDVPASVLVGTADRLTPPVLAEQLAAALPRLEQLITLPGRGHMTPVEDPGAVEAEIRRLVAAHVKAEVAA